MNGRRRYILVTPVKNEIGNLPALIKSVTSQSVRPVAWFIVDDGSTDGSTEAIERLTQEHSWIRMVRLPPSAWDAWMHYSAVIKSGIDHGLTYLRTNDETCDYLGILDADITVGEDYFRFLIERFEEEPDLGIASGGAYIKRHGRLIWEKTTSVWPTGGAMLVKRECLELVGYQVGRAADSLMFVRAALGKFKTRQYKRLMAVQSRPTYTGRGFWQGFMNFGRIRYYLGYSPVFAVIYAIRLMFSFPFMHGPAFLFGYFGDYVKRGERIRDEKILNFYKHRPVAKMKEIIADSFSRRT